jgi:predicted nucleic acid-binding protein
MTLAELFAWAKENNWGPSRRNELARFLRQYEVVWPDDELCQSWAQIRADAKKAGKPIDVADGWIAATTLELKVHLVTHNPTDFRQVKGLKVLSALDA